MPSSADQSATRLLRAQWIAPMDRAVIQDGIIAVRGGRIADVGPAAQVLAHQPDAVLEELGNVVLFPGLVNAHLHLELSDLTPGESPASFVDWLLAVMAKGPPPGPAGEARAAAAARAGIAQCLRFGVTTVGDITRFPAVTRTALAESPLRAVSFAEVTAMGERRRLLEPRVAAAMAPSPAPDRVIAAVSPHAPYSIELGGYERCVAAAKAAGVPVATHLAESADEEQFLASHSGPFRRLWDTIGGWDDQVPLVAGGPMMLAERVGLFRDVRGVLAHVNYIDDTGLRLLAGSRASVVYCPRTHAYFGHPPHPWRRMLELGINVAVGTDSTASSPDLNLVDDLRLIRRNCPEVSAETLWGMASVNGAAALGMADEIGAIRAGMLAHLVAFPVRSPDPLSEVLDNQLRPSAVWIGGVGPLAGSTT